MTSPKFCSILFVHYGSSDTRRALMKESFESLVNNLDYPCEIIVVDNGPFIEDSEYFLQQLANNKINTYIRNKDNMHFGYSRNEALRLSQGDFICVVDNDIIYQPKWLSTCIKVLEKYPDRKIWATPVYNVAHWLPKFWSGELDVDGEIYRLNQRAGSNCWVMRREDMQAIGEFVIHRVAGTKWTDRANKMGYFGAVTPVLLVKDRGFRKGYDYKVPVLVKETLSDGTEVNYNQDEYPEFSQSGKIFVTPKKFI